jgi:hypothetical protein
MIERYVKGKKGRVGMLYAEQTGPVKSAIVEAFSEDRTEDKKGNELLKQKDNFQYIIGTPRQLGTGHQLTRACNVILMEPDVDFGMETQGFSRVKRPGQKNSRSNTYKLLDAGSDIETQIQNEHAKNEATHGEFVREWQSSHGVPVPKNGQVTFSAEPGGHELDIAEETYGDATQYGSSSFQKEDREAADRSTLTQSRDGAQPRRSGAIRRSRKAGSVTPRGSGQSEDSSPHRNPRRKKRQDNLNRHYSDEEVLGGTSSDP